MTARGQERPLGVARSLVDVLALVAELAVFALLAVAGWHLADVLVLRVVLAVLLPATAIAVWGLLLAPRSSRRLRQPARLVVQLAVFGATAALALAAGLDPVGWVVPAAAALVFLAVLATDPRS